MKKSRQVLQVKDCALAIHIRAFDDLPQVLPVRGRYSALIIANRFGSDPMNAPVKPPVISPTLPGLPLVESPFFHNEIDKLHLTPHQRRIAVDLHERGYAVIKFPDEEFDARAERLIET